MNSLPPTLSSPPGPKSSVRVSAREWEALISDSSCMRVSSSSLRFCPCCVYQEAHLSRCIEAPLLWYGSIIHMRQRHKRNITKCVLVEVHITPTKVKRMGARSAKSNPGSSKDSNSLNGLLKMKMANPQVSVSEAASKILLVNVSLKGMTHRCSRWMRHDIYMKMVGK